MSDIYCPLDKILSVASRDGYRNKCEFTIGLDKEAEVWSTVGHGRLIVAFLLLFCPQPCVGFRMGSFKDGSVVVAHVSVGNLCYYAGPVA